MKVNNIQLLPSSEVNVESCQPRVVNIYIPKYYYSMPNVLKYKLLLSSKKKSELIKLSKFINHINKTVCTQLSFLFKSENSVIHSYLYNNVDYHIFYWNNTEFACVIKA
jgi:hypothetical protein